MLACKGTWEPERGPCRSPGEARHVLSQRECGAMARSLWGKAQLGCGPGIGSWESPWPRPAPRSPRGKRQRQPASCAQLTSRGRMTVCATALASPACAGGLRPRLASDHRPRVSGLGLFIPCTKEHLEAASGRRSSEQNSTQARGSRVFRKTLHFPGHCLRCVFPSGGQDRKSPRRKPSTAGHFPW